MSGGPPDEGGVPADPAPFPPFDVLSSERIYDSSWIALRRDELALPGGGTQEYHVVEIGDAVCVLPVTSAGEVVLIGQHRHPHGDTHWEAPAGRVEDGEDPAAGALRELREETGYEAAEVRSLPGFYPVNGISAHWVHLYAATGCEPRHEQDLDPSERIIVRTFTWAECEALLRAGRIKDGLTALALLYGRWLLGEGAAPTEPRS